MDWFSGKKWNAVEHMVTPFSSVSNEAYWRERRAHSSSVCAIGCGEVGCDVHLSFASELVLSRVAGADALRSEVGRIK